MTEPPIQQSPRALVLYFDSSLARIMHEILALEGYAVFTTQVAAEALGMLRRLDGDCLVIMDNLQVSAQGQDFLAARRRDSGLCSRTKVISMAIQLNCERLRDKYGDEIDAHLALPFTLDEFCRVVENLCARP